MPVIGPRIRGHVGLLTGSGAALAVGLVGALWTGLGVTLAMGSALDRIWAVPALERPGFVASRLRGLVVLVAVGSFTVAATAAVGFATAGASESVIAAVLSFAGGAAIELVVFLTSFRLLTAAPVTVRHVLPGAVLAAGCWLVLQAVGGLYITRVLKGSSQTYGGFDAERAMRASAQADRRDRRQHIAVTFDRPALRGDEFGEEDPADQSPAP